VLTALVEAPSPVPGTLLWYHICMARYAALAPHTGAERPRSGAR